VLYLSGASQEVQAGSRSIKLVLSNTNLMSLPPRIGFSPTG